MHRPRRHRFVGIVGIVLALAGTTTIQSANAAVLAQAGTVEIAFTPDDPVDERIIAVINGAHEQIHILAYAFTHRGIARALQAARSRGVEVLIVADRSQTLQAPRSALPELKRRGFAIWLDAAPGNAHNKVLIVDPRSPGATTITGSFNFTRAAQKSNAENIVIFHGNRDVARIYERYFERRRKAAQAWSASASNGPPATAGAISPRPPSGVPGTRNEPFVERRVP